jgi:hypothetical protein
MCVGGRLLADFEVGTTAAPIGMPDVVARSLTQTVDGDSVIWATKVAWIDGDQFHALTGSTYPWDAVASCHRDPTHAAPDRFCTCGFHAVSDSKWGTRSLGFFGGPPSFGRWATSRLRRRTDDSMTSTMEMVALSVALSGRVLAFEWIGNAVLFRAQRQTVVRVLRAANEDRQPDDPSGTLARVMPTEPAGAGPMRLSIPASAPVSIAIADDAGYCIAASASAVAETTSYGFDSASSDRRLVTT